MSFPKYNADEEDIVFKVQEAILSRILDLCLKDVWCFYRARKVKDARNLVSPHYLFSIGDISAKQYKIVCI